MVTNKAKEGAGMNSGGTEAFQYKGTTIAICISAKEPLQGSFALFLLRNLTWQFYSHQISSTLDVNPGFFYLKMDLTNLLLLRFQPPCVQIQYLLAPVVHLTTAEYNCAK